MISVEQQLAPDRAQIFASELTGYLLDTLEQHPNYNEALRYRERGINHPLLEFRHSSMGDGIWLPQDNQGFYRQITLLRYLVHTPPYGFTISKYNEGEQLFWGGASGICGFRDKNRDAHFFTVALTDQEKLYDTPRTVNLLRTEIYELLPR